MAIAEFALVLPFLFIILLPTIDLGLLTQARLIISHLAREGGSIASRQVTIDPALTGMIQASAKPLELDANGRIYITRITAGKSTGSSAPTITTQLTAGSLGVASGYAGGRTRLGLSATLYDHLVFKGSPQNAADIPQVTIVEVYYRYNPITPLRFLTEDGGGTIVGSKSVF
jgi:Flp pilus assembly protein TadG